MLCVEKGHFPTCPNYDQTEQAPDEPGQKPERWWCKIVGHKLLLWVDNGGRRPCGRCWERRKEWV